MSTTFPAKLPFDPTYAQNRDRVAARRAKSAVRLTFIAVAAITVLSMGVLAVGGRLDVAKIAGASLVVVFALFLIQSRSAAVCLLFLLQPFEGVVRAWMGGRYLTFVYASLAVIILYGMRDRGGWTKFLTQTPARYLLAWTGWAACSYLWSVDELGWLQEIAVLLGMVCGLALVPLVIKTRPLLNAAIFCYIVGSVLYVFFNLSLYAEARRGALGAFDDISGAEVTRIWAVAILLTAFLLEQVSGWNKILCWATIAVLLLACMLNTTRGTLLALLAALVVNAALKRGIIKKPVQAIVIAGVAASMFMVAYSVAPTLWERRIVASSSERVDTMTSGRTSIWRASAASFADNPILGLGAGNFVARFPDFYFAAGETYMAGKGAKGAHSVYVATIVELGLPGLLCLGMFMVSIVKRSLKLPTELRRHALSWAAFVFAGFTFMTSREIQLFWLLGIIIQFEWIQRENRLGAIQPRTARRYPSEIAS